MDILATVKAERDKLNRIIAMLEGEVSSSIKKAIKRGHKWTEAEKKAMSLKQKALWAKKKKH